MGCGHDLPNHPADPSVCSHVTHCLFSYSMSLAFWIRSGKHFLDLTSQFQYRSDIIGLALCVAFGNLYRP